MIGCFGGCERSFNTFIFSCYASEVKEAVAYSCGIEACALFNYVSGSMSLIHEAQGGIIARFNADSEVVHAKCG